MKILLLLFGRYAYRLLKLKIYEDDDKYVTMIDGSLALCSFSSNNVENQRIVIHKRKLSFSSNNVLYNLTLDSDDMKIKLKPEKHVAYLTRQKTKSQKKKDLFGFHKPSKTKRPSRDLIPKNNPNKTKSIQQEQQPTQVPVQVEDKDIKNIETEKEEVVEEKQNVDMNVILNKVKSLLNEKKNYLVESDSKIEEDIVKYKKVEVFVHPMDSKYIKLKTKEKDCITYIDNKFIFTPCLNVDAQIFRLEREEKAYKEMSEKYDDHITNYKSRRKSTPILTRAKKFISNFKKPIKQQDHRSRKGDGYEDDDEFVKDVPKRGRHYNSVSIDAPYIEHQDDIMYGKHKDDYGGIGQKHVITATHKHEFKVNADTTKPMPGPKFLDGSLSESKNRVAYEKKEDAVATTTQPLVQNIAKVKAESTADQIASPDDILQKLKLDINDSAFDSLLN